DPRSFASRLARILRARERSGVALGKLLAVPEVEHSSLCVLEIRLPAGRSYAVTALNFGRGGVREAVDISAIEKDCRSSLSGPEVMDVVGGAAVGGTAEGRVGEGGRLEVELEALSGKLLLLGPRE